MQPPSFWSTRDTEKPIRFLLRLLGENLLLTSVVYSCVLLVLAGGSLEKSGVAYATSPAMQLVDQHWFLIGVIAMPLIETVLIQLIPIEITRRFTSRFWYQVLPSWLLFAGLHFLNSIENGLSAGIIAGWYYALTYYLFRSKSKWYAATATFLLHASANFILSCPD